MNRDKTFVMVEKDSVGNLNFYPMYYKVDGSLWNLHHDDMSAPVAYDSYEIANAVCIHFNDEGAAFAPSGIARWSYRHAMWEHQD